ncbi:YitT family protein [Clostridium fermenticellae]|nr:YitT family protein [Clostridium fermenticellae]
MKANMIDLKSTIFDTAVIIFAIFIFSLALNVFFSPHHIVAGGVSGLAIVLESVLHIKKSIIIGFLNIPIFLLGLITLGKKFVINTVLGAFLVPVFVELTSNVEPFTKDPLLAVLLGGVVTGIAVGMLLTKEASVGGTDTVAKMISKFINKPVGKIMMCIDLSIVLLSVCVFGIEKALYGVVSVCIIGRVVDVYIKGFKDSKSVLIISDRIDEINDLILTKIDGRTTKLEGRGGYTNHEQIILMCVITSRELIKLKKIVKNIDTNALVLVQDSYEVYGKGFSIN